MATHSSDIYRELVEESDDNWILGLTSFAIVEEQRIEWERHFQAHNGRSPNTTEVSHWYDQQPPGVLRRARHNAATALQTHAEDSLAEILDAERRAVVESTIVGEIREARRFWPQFGVNVAGGFTSAFLFAAMLAILAYVALTDMSPSRIVTELNGPNAEESRHGEIDGTQ